jgi:hypothetical protein
MLEQENDSYKDGGLSGVSRVANEHAHHPNPQIPFPTIAD